jgi:hypothetical protein
MFEREVGGQPGGVFEIMQGRHAFHQVRREEGGRGKDYELGLVFGVSRQNAEVFSPSRDSTHHAVGADKASHSFEQAANDPTVALGPG